MAFDVSARLHALLIKQSIHPLLPLERLDLAALSIGVHGNEDAVERGLLGVYKGVIDQVRLLDKLHAAVENAAVENTRGKTCVEESREKKRVRRKA